MIKKLKSIIIKIYIKAKERRFNVSDQVLKYIFYRQELIVSD